MLDLCVHVGCQTGKFVSDNDVLAQTEQTLKNLGAILGAAGTTEQNGT